MKDNYKFKLGLALAREKELIKRVAALEAAVAPIVREFDEYDERRYAPITDTYLHPANGEEQEGGAFVRVRLLRELCKSVGLLEPEKYDDTLLPFLSLMRKELHANSDKGDRDGWLGMTSGSALEEIEHHRQKLVYAVACAKPELIKEHAADVANCAMMLLDVCGGLGISPSGGLIDA